MSSVSDLAPSRSLFTTINAQPQPQSALQAVSLDAVETGVSSSVAPRGAQLATLTKPRARRLADFTNSRALVAPFKAAKEFGERLVTGEPARTVEGAQDVGSAAGVGATGGAVVGAWALGSLAGTAVLAIALTAGIELCLDEPAKPFNPNGVRNLGGGISLIVLSTLVPAIPAAAGVIGAGLGAAAGAVIGGCLGCCLSPCVD